MPDPPGFGGPIGGWAAFNPSGFSGPTGGWAAFNPSGFSGPTGGWGALELPKRCLRGALEVP